ncbi:MAG: chemotaxis response regulator protein-glutamate methylesterase, partial [Deltaproteobacteria bacterium]|nr:chemotaxis response regulator protein-glutamate methylesterase [Deltaproteobacteria bacterium]
MEKIKVLIVDDSAVVRQTLEKVLSSDREIEVVGTAPDPYAAAKKMKTLVPDVITLDVEMPRMDGITFLKKIMSQHPIPVVICSSLTGKGSETALKALEYGAVEIIHKPLVGTKQFIEESNILICDVVKAAAQTRKGRTLKKTTVIEPTKKLSADVILQKADKKAMVQTTERVVVVGASTGGTEALRVFLEALPYNSPGIVVVQHMPENFTTAFAGRLNDICQVSVKEAANNDSVIPGHVLIAPGNKHPLLKRSGARYYVEVKDGPLVSRHRPSVDVLFRSASRYAGKNVCGVILTGMGDDGAKGML